MPGPGWDRRRVLRAGAAAVGGAGVGWTSSAVLGARLDAAAGDTGSGGADEPTPVTLTPSAGSETVAFHGPHQAGVATAAQAHLALVGLDLRPGVGRQGLVRLMRLLSDDAARLSAGEAALADTEPELASAPSRLTVTFGFGPRVLRELVPTDRGVRLAELPAFRTDELDPAWGQTDLAVQVCSDDPVSVAHARRMLLKDARPFTDVRWTQEGFRRARGSEADGTTMRNLMGQVDGTANLAEADPDFADLVWADDASGMPGGTFLVVRRIRMHLDRWDKVDRVGREAVVGRRLDTGAPLTGVREHDEPDLEATDDLGLPVIDPASHLSRARSDDPRERFLRRGYNYLVPDPARPGGEDAGLVFIAFAADVDRQFVPVQRRLAELDRLNAWVTTIGSAVYAVPPGAGPGDYVGSSLLDGPAEERGT